jgi:hypothetical protein
MIDPSKPLKNARHERFACELAKVQSKAAAYRSAGFTDDRREASRLATNPDIQARTEWIKAQAADGDVMDIAEKRRIAAEIARNREEESRDRIAACRLDNDLSEHGAEAKGMSALAAMVQRLRV